jgi:hypothetical protein
VQQGDPHAREAFFDGSSARRLSVELRDPGQHIARRHGDLLHASVLEPASQKYFSGRIEDALVDLALALLRWPAEPHRAPLPLADTSFKSFFNQNGMQVAVVKDGTAHIHKVSVTRDLGMQVEVDGGVEQGDLVIINPPITLREGSKIRARAEPAAPRT